MFESNLSFPEVSFPTGQSYLIYILNFEREIPDKTNALSRAFTELCVQTFAAVTACKALKRCTILVECYSERCDKKALFLVG